ncbi:MAG TPA: TadE family protein [Sphingomicrobium sp.]|jgi:Flp pilus assembly protein TadG|nr:TadE family protein [Sphingomicrobium sp.]
MMFLGRLLKNEGGAAVIELAIALPVLVTMIYGIFECSQLYEANAGMQHALGEGARIATLCVPDANATSGCDNPTDTAILNGESAKLFRPAGGSFSLTIPSAAAGYKTLQITYTRSMNFLLVPGPTITLTRTKQVYVPDTGTGTATCGMTGGPSVSSCTVSL